MDDVDTNPGAGGRNSQSALALERLVDPVVGVAEGRITEANEAAREAFDVSSGDDPASAFEEWPLLEQAIADATAGTARTVELAGERFDARIHRGVDGTTLVFESTGSHEPPADDRVVKDRAMNEAPVGIAISDPDQEDNPLVYVNEAYEVITGYDTGEVIGRNCRFLQGEDSDESTIAEMAAAVDEERPVTVEILNYRKDGTEFWNEVTIAPVYDDDGELTNYVGFQNDVTARKEAELALERRTAELEFVLDRVEGLIQDVTTAVAGSTHRSTLEQAVCERFVEEPNYEGAWIGERNPATEQIVVRERAGDVSPPSGDDPSATISTADEHPAAVAVRSGESVLETDGRTRAAFPLVYNDVEYGVLVLEAAPEAAIDDRESVILSALARAVASGINARETSRVLATDAVVAVDVDVTDPDLAPVAISSAVDCRLEYRRSSHRTGDRTASLYTVTGPDATAEALESALQKAGLEGEVVVERDGECLLEVTDQDDPVAWLSDRGVRLVAIEGDEGRARLTLEIPRSADVRSVVEGIEDRYDGSDVVSFHQREPGGDTRQEFAARLESELTERQFVALQRAYLGGYFEWPRPTTGEELAETMGVSRPTFHEHLRSAEAKLCSAFFEGNSS
ncbi:bacterio-opsin activator domain-containing protein [Natrarchaeobaculum aegyptiacum]|uniref:Histidine kinase n=1 Tax=Natrarchaeobaculum aegyptiacum TaxID=745377 RepID=A0A2Z2HR27_9EURY|nr:bacterio-opsin activator domain-containing protein [Natrarchaeobaculum aegyptiacum]ARS89499.1 histidine kinase [Natrarchaeobaculum aegyptiacum]